MKDLESDDFLLWYLEKQGYEMTLKKLNKSLQIKSQEKISKKKIKKFEKIKNEIITGTKPKEPLLILLFRYFKKYSHCK